VSTTKKNKNILAIVFLQKLRVALKEPAMWCQCLFLTIRQCYVLCHIFLEILELTDLFYSPSTDKIFSIEIFFSLNVYKH